MTLKTLTLLALSPCEPETINKASYNFISTSIMRTFSLKLRADLENCTDVEPLDHKEYPHDYGFRFMCSKCRYVHPKEIIVNRFDIIDIDLIGFRRRGNFQIKCKDCHNEIFFILTKPETKLTAEKSKAGEYVPILDIHVHGCIVTEFVLEDQFQCKTTTGQVVEEVDLRRGEWAEFDEENNLPINITNASFELEQIMGNGSIVTL